MTVYFRSSSYDPDESFHAYRSMHDLRIETDDIISLEDRQPVVPRTEGMRPNPQYFKKGEINDSWKLYGMEDEEGGPVEIFWIPGKERG